MNLQEFLVVLQKLTFKKCLTFIRLRNIVLKENLETQHGEVCYRENKLFLIFLENKGFLETFGIIFLIVPILITTF